MNTEDWRGEHLIRSAPRKVDIAPKEILTEAQMERDILAPEVRRLAVNGKAQCDIAKELGLHPARVWRICRDYKITPPDARRIRPKTGRI